MAPSAAAGLLALLSLVALTHGSSASRKRPSVGAINVDGVDLSHYYHHNEVVQLAQRLSSQHPHLVQRYSVGTSVQGRELLVMKISENVAQRDLCEPMVKYVANMHGDEAVGQALVVALAQYLVFAYNKGDPRVVRLLNTTEIHLMPSMNPDGFEIAREGTCDGTIRSGRENAHDVDLNRNFPSQWSNLSEEYIYSNREPETLAVMAWIINNPFVLSGNLHGGSVVASYPFDDTISHADCCVESKSPDDELFHYLATVYASKHRTMHTGSVCNDGNFTGGVTNGAYWYDVEGGMQDFNYVFGSCSEVTFELSCCKYPWASTLPQEWDNNKESLMAYMEQVHMGVKGIVEDAATGEGLKGIYVSVEELNYNVTTSERGEYWRLLMAGNYTLVAKGYGYETVKQRISVAKGVVSRVDLKMKRTVLGYAEQPTGALNRKSRSVSGSLSTLMDSPDPSLLATLNNTTWLSDSSSSKLQSHSYLKCSQSPQALLQKPHYKKQNPLEK